MSHPNLPGPFSWRKASIAKYFGRRDVAMYKYMMEKRTMNKSESTGPFLFFFFLTSRCWGVGDVVKEKRSENWKGIRLLSRLSRGVARIMHATDAKRKKKAKNIKHHST